MRDSSGNLRVLKRLCVILFSFVFVCFLSLGPLLPSASSVLTLGLYFLVAAEEALGFEPGDFLAVLSFLETSQRLRRASRVRHLNFPHYIVRGYAIQYGARWRTEPQ